MIGDIRKFRFWCQKVLPLVYDDSLSYYEVLCKVVTYLNNVIADVNTIPEYIDGVIDEKLSDEHLQELIEQFVLNIESAISSNNEGDNTNSSADYNIGQMLWWNGKLYKVIRQIDAGDTFIVDTNIELVNFEDLFNNFLAEIKDNFTSNDDGGSPTATQSWTAGTWLWLNDVLYIVKSDIAEGNAYIFSGVNANVEQINVEDEIKKEATTRTNADNALQTAISNEIQARQNADTALQTAINNEIQARQNADTTLQTAINNEIQARQNADTTLQTAINNEIQARQNAINEVLNTTGNLDNLDTTDKDNLVDAINEVNTKVDNVHSLAPVSRVVLFSDSYGLTVNDVTPFTDVITTMLSGSAVDYEYYAVGSIGIVPNSAQSLGLSGYIDTYWYSQISTPETVTDVVIALGANDIPRRGSLPTYFTTLCDNLKIKFPNARILFAFIGQTYAESIADRNSTINAYKNNAKKNGCYYMNGSDYVMQDGYNLQSDEVHPNSDGANHLATMIVQNLVNDSYHYSASHMNVTVTMDDDSKTFTFNLLIYDNMATLNVNTGGSAARTFPVTFETGTFTTVPFRGSGSMYANVSIGDSTNRGSLMMTVNNKKFYLRAIGKAITTSGTYEMVGLANCYMNLNN